jgi:flagellar assembly factor FliW
MELDLQEQPRMTTTPTPNLQRCETRYFGPVEYDDDSVLVFPDGVPAFEEEKRFVAIRQPINEPLVFLQSLSQADLCFVTLPVLALCPGFRLSIAPEDLEALDLGPGQQPVIGRDVLCLAVVCVEENAPPTANLLAPIVVNLRTRRGRQVIQTDSKYSHRETLPVKGAACS